MSTPIPPGLDWRQAIHRPTGETQWFAFIERPEKVQTAKGPQLARPGQALVKGGDGLFSLLGRTQFDAVYDIQ